MNGPSPEEIVQELDKHIVGQSQAKRAVAIALRNRERRKELPPELRSEVMPKNILMIGPTGVGKTEIARRMAALVDAPFVKVDATKFTEVGYVGRDVDSIIVELVENSVLRIYEQRLSEVKDEAEKLARERLVDYLCQQASGIGRLARRGRKQVRSHAGSATASQTAATGRPLVARSRVAELLDNHQLEDQVIEIEISNDVEGALADLRASLSPEGMADPYDALGDSLRQQPGPRRRRVSVKEARRILTQDEAAKLMDFDQLVDQAMERAQESGMVFIDEIDKLAAPTIDVGRDISGEGVQRDLLPILGGSAIMTRYGLVKSDHILFIAAGTFYQTKPSDLIPELQGRLPLRVQLQPLSEVDLRKILGEPQHSLCRQYQALLATEGVELAFSEDGIAEMARLAAVMNERVENIGARRLFTIMEKVLEDLNFTAPSLGGQRVVIDAAYVTQHTGGLAKNEDLSRYIL